MDYNLQGKVVLITGGSRGMGAAMSRAFANAGCRVGIASRKLDNCQELAQSINAQIEAATTEAGQKSEMTQPAAHAMPCNVSDWDDCTRLVEQSLEHFGRIDVLINNAGMSPLYNSLTDVSQELFDKVINVNLRGPFRLSALCAEHMMQGEGGSIINVSSIAAARPGAGELPYAAAKAGLNALTKGMSKAFAPKVRVNCIVPGPFLTDIAKAWDMEHFDRVVKPTIPLGRAGEAHEVVGAALYLASDQASYTTGSLIKIDGGVVDAV